MTGETTTGSGVADLCAYRRAREAAQAGARIAAEDAALCASEALGAHHAGALLAALGGGRLPPGPGLRAALGIIAAALVSEGWEPHEIGAMAIRAAQEALADRAEA